MTFFELIHEAATGAEEIRRDHLPSGGDEDQEEDWIGLKPGLRR
jgi:hypothetical protein